MTALSGWENFCVIPENRGAEAEGGCCIVFQGVVER
jgi:hypothetical protein